MHVLRAAPAPGGLHAVHFAIGPLGGFYVADAERLPGSGPPDHLGVLMLEDMKQAEGERLSGAALAEALPLLL